MNICFSLNMQYAFKYMLLNNMLLISAFHT